MRYKGYRGQVTYDEDGRTFYGRVVGLKDVITFQGTTVDELEQAFKDSVDAYFEYCTQLGDQPEKPCSGNLRLRMKPELHAELVMQAAKEGVSLNTLINNKLSSCLY